jgi:hypothetical protein
LVAILRNGQSNGTVRSTPWRERRRRFEAMSKNGSYTATVLKGTLRQLTGRGPKLIAHSLFPSRL